MIATSKTFSRMITNLGRKDKTIKLLKITEEDILLLAEQVKTLNRTLNIQAIEEKTDNLDYIKSNHQKKP